MDPDNPATHLLSSCSLPPTPSLPSSQIDYDRNDALLQSWIFRNTQGDAWFKPEEEHISSGVTLGVSDRPYTVHPLEYLY